MRETKFRAWNGEKYSHFVIGQPIYDRLQDYDAACINGETFEQYTGLHDKNGKEIYEKDKINDEYVVEWSKIKCGFILRDISNDDIFDIDAFEESDMEVTGNEHEI